MDRKTRKIKVVTKRQWGKTKKKQKATMGETGGGTDFLYFLNQFLNFKNTAPLPAKKKNPHQSGKSEKISTKCQQTVLSLKREEMGKMKTGNKV